MWAIWAKQLLPEALKSCPKYNKSPIPVTLGGLNLKSQLFYFSFEGVEVGCILWIEEASNDRQKSFINLAQMSLHQNEWNEKEWNVVNDD